MVYTLMQGAQGYNHKLHYSLYGGVEYLPERVKFALKELLPLTAIPAVAIALLVAIVNFHVPILSPATAGGDTESASGSQARSVVLSAKQTTSNSKNDSSASSSTSAGRSGTATISTLSPSATLTPLGNDNGQGIVVGGMGSGGGSTVPAPVETPPPTTTTVPVDTPLVQGDATVNTQQPQAGVDVVAPLAGASVGASVGL